MAAYLLNCEEKDAAKDKITAHKSINSVKKIGKATTPPIWLLKTLL